MLRKIYLNILAILRVYVTKDFFVFMGEIRRVWKAQPLLGTVVSGVTTLSLPTPYNLQNGSITRDGNTWIVAVRTVNYKVTGLLLRMKLPNGPQSADSRTWLIRLNDQLQIISSEQLDEEPYRDPRGRAKNGFEDPRIFHWHGELWGLWTAGQVLTNDWENVFNTMVLGRIQGAQLDELHYLESPHGLSREKNWMPWIRDNDLYMVYRVSNMETYRVTASGMELVNKMPQADPRLKGYGGGSPLVPWGDDYICALHYGCRVTRMATAKLLKFFYIQRFAIIGRDFSIRALSREFFLEHKGTEFCAGMAVHDGEVVLSYSVGEGESHVMRLTVEQVKSLFSV